MDCSARSVIPNPWCSSTSERCVNGCKGLFCYDDDTGSISAKDLAGPPVPASYGYALPPPYFPIPWHACQEPMSQVEICKQRLHVATVASVMIDAEGINFAAGIAITESVQAFATEGIFATRILPPVCKTAMGSSASGTTNYPL